MSLKKIINPLIKNNDYGASFCNFNEVDENGKILNEYFKKKEYFNYLYKKNYLTRAIRFFLDPEYMGKANLFYSIFRKKLFDKNKFEVAHKYFGLNADRLFLFDFIQRNKIFIRKEKLFNVTVHNKKFYKTRRIQKVFLLKYVYQQFLGYIFFSKSLILKILIIIFMPYKLYQLLLRKLLF